MTINEYPRLCGGTFFTLVLQALQQRMNAREHYDGDSDGLSDPEVLVGLIKVINPAYTDPGKERLKTIVNNYKRCESSTSTYFPFSDDQVVAAFDRTVRTDYQTALNGMVEFVNDFLDVSKAVHKDANLVRALVDLIQQDQSIESETEFYVGQNGEKKKKAALGDLKEVCLPSFLLGVWHFVVVNRKDNSVGKKTYDVWCPSAGGGQRKYIAHMGEGILEGLTISYADTVEKVETDAEPVETVIIEDVPEQPVQQTVNNPFVFNFNQYGNNGTQIGHVENYFGGKKKED
ncbi:hypothetical protein [Anaeromassilibacillus senegalensis]|uniref:Uncharacterized protein n=1 Tax=Anaeromassilibacillus senegalensis TaxID=1673717 RepID=A0ABS9CP97_9FIRM|nr:hypothetical protein [Anaeromassilibacillus senegalensis]MCF2652972.1 hypothetical protein [Anaeromassilibacillus senegalensis]